MGEAKHESPVKPNPMRQQQNPTRQQQIVKREAAIPPSQFGRVRALASYGMTQEQVAELYGVGVEVIERIVR
jgi:DNA-binding transcriptional regulator YiaG